MAERQTGPMALGAEKQPTYGDDNESEAMAVQPWMAVWVIKDIPDDGFDVIRDGRPIGIHRCDSLEQAVEEIIVHPIFQDGDRVVCRDGHHERDVDVRADRPELFAV
jgi:hypothetical protein